MCLDHDLGGRQVSDNEDNGATFARLIADRINQSAAVAVHSYNSVGARRILAELSGTGVSAYLTPFRGPMFTAVIDAVISS